PMQLRDLVQWTIRPRLLAVPGVARATLYGGDERQLQVQVEPRELNARDLAFGDVVAAVRSATGVRGGGFIETPNQRVLIESRGQTLDVAALGAAVVPVAAPAPAAPAGTALPLRLRDFATVTDGVAPKFGDTLIMGRLGVLLNLSSQYGANTLIVTRAVEAALAELAVALGVVVDDAIIGVENIVRRLRGTHAHGLEAREVIHNATLEVRAPVVYATFVVVLVLAPMLLLSGLQGSFFAPLAASFSLATLASLLVALTVTPAAAWLLLRRTEPHAEAAWLTRLKDRHEALLRRWSAFPRRVIIGSALVTLLAAAALPLFGSDLLPPFRECHFVVQAYATPRTSLTPMRALRPRVARDLLAIPGIVTVEQTMGRAESGEDTWEPNRSEFHVELGRMSGRAEEATQAAIRAALQHYPSLRTEVLTFLGDRLSESLSGEVAPVAVNVFGPDLDELDRVADEIAAVARTVPGASDVQVQAPSGAPFLRVDLRPEQLGQYGFTAADVLDTVETAYQGTTAAQVYDANKVIDLTVRLPPAERVDPEAIGQLLVRTANGLTVPLKDLATLALTEGRTGIMHEGARRRQVVTLNPTTSDIGGFVARLQKAVARRVK